MTSYQLGIKNNLLMITCADGDDVLQFDEIMSVEGITKETTGSHTQTEKTCNTTNMYTISSHNIMTPHQISPLKIRTMVQKHLGLTYQNVNI